MSQTIPTNAEERALYWEEKHKRLQEELAKLEAELKDTQRQLKQQKVERDSGKEH